MSHFQSYFVDTKSEMSFNHLIMNIRYFCAWIMNSLYIPLLFYDYLTFLKKEIQLIFGIIF